jgi:3-hydroxyacyl-[acyl-carrier-protein] dehydratase
VTELPTPLGSFTIPADHPSLQGHFPGNPVVPGVVLLDHALALILPAHGRLVRLPSVKFTRIVRPGEVIEVLAWPLRSGRLDFVARCGAAEVLRGSLEPAA